MFHSLNIMWRRRNRGVLIGMLVLFIFILLLMNTMVNHHKSSLKINENLSSKELELNKVKLVDSLENLSILYENVQALQLIKAFYEELINNERINYYESYTQPIYIADFKGYEHMLYGYEEGEDRSNTSAELDGKTYDFVKCISMNNWESYSINSRIQEGRGFDKDDFQDCKHIPLILGDEYKNVYELGDLVEIDYLEAREVAEIIGFLEKGTTFDTGRKVMFLDRYTIIPSLNYPNSPSNKEAQVFQARLYMQKLNGTVELDDGYALEEFLSEFTNMIDEYGMFGFTYYELNPFVIELLLLSSEERIETVLIYMILLSLVFGILSIIILWNVMTNNLKSYTIHIICGASFNEIVVSNYLGIIIFVLSANLIAFIMNLLTLGELVPYSIVTIAFSGIVGIILCVVNKQMLLKTNLIKTMRYNNGVYKN